MAHKSDLYRKLTRLREKRKRIDRRVNTLERKLAGKVYTRPFKGQGY